MRFHKHGVRVYWYCPGCDCSHEVPVDDGEGQKWDFNGDAQTPTLAPSVLVTMEHCDGRKDICHTYVRNGQIQFLSDCTHKLAGQTVDVPTWSDYYDEEFRRIYSEEQREADYLKPCECCGSILGCYCHEYPHKDNPKCPGNYGIEVSK